MSAGGDDLEPRERVARLLARLAHRFSDREAILWRGGLDEDTWTELERDVLAVLGAPGASAHELADFARAFVDARLELTRGSAGPATVAVPTTQAPTIPNGPHSYEEGAVTVPRPTRRATLELGTPRDGGTGDAYEVPIRPRIVLDDPSTDEDSLSQTIHSPGQVPKSGPPSR